MPAPLQLLADFGRLLVNLREASAIAYNGTREGIDWFFKLNRLYIETYTKHYFPGCYKLLDGGDIRMITAFLEPESISNTYSLLGGAGGSSAQSELRFSGPELREYLSDMFGTLARRDSPVVIADAAAYQGNERWFYINGIISGRTRVAKQAAALKAAFGRDFITIHNPTQGLVHDIVESALEKFTNTNTEVVARAFVEVAKALLDPDVDKVAVIAHSQGTIIMGDVLDLIYVGIDANYLDRTNMNDGDVRSFLKFSYGTVHSYELRRLMTKLHGQKHLIEKLELYLFANAASRVCYLSRDEHIPHIESYANEHDIVTRLGVLARDTFHEEDLVRIDGPVFTSKRYGHQFTAHYLPGFIAGQYQLLEPYKGLCIRDSVHDSVRGNPCAKNPLRVEGPRQSRLQSYLAAEAAPDLAARRGNGSPAVREYDLTETTRPPAVASAVRIWERGWVYVGTITTMGG
jgi:hypothetical protein